MKIFKEISYIYSKCSFHGTLSSAFKVVECERKNVHFQIRCNTIWSHRVERRGQTDGSHGLWRAAAAAAAGVMQYLCTGIGSRALERGGGPVCDSPALILLLILSSRLSGHLLCYCCTSPSPPCTYRPTVGLGQPSEPSSRTTIFYTLLHSKVFLLFPHIMRRMVYFTYWGFIILSSRMRTCLINQFQISLPCLESRVEEDINPAARSPLPTTAAKQRVRRTSTWTLTDSL